MEFLYLLSSHRTPFLDSVFSFITKFGEEVIALGLICTLLWCVDKTLAYSVGYAFFFSAMCIQGLKVAFRIPRPWVIDPTFVPVNSAVKAATGYSFPSGHTQVACSIYGTLGFSSKKKGIKLVMFSIIAGVAFSRMYLGVHTPKDVIVSFIISILISYFTVRVLTTGANSTHFNLISSSLLFFSSIAIWFFSVYLYRTDIISLHYASDCCKVAGSALGFSLGLFIEKTYINYTVKTDKISQQILKVTLGIASLLVFKGGLKLLLGASIAADTFRYFFLILWAIVLWPLLFTRFLKYKNRQ
ncbi:MAG: phosphatase PAP2 family protein [Oscillospiraceae bacterium]